MKRALALLAGMTLVGCGTELTVTAGEETNLPGLTWEEFLSYTYQEPDTGVYVANGDEVFETITDLDAYWREYLSGDRLIIYYRSGADVKWTAAEAQNLTYCVSSGSFGSLYNTTVSAMSSATGAWEATGARINFIHSASQDSSCNNRNGAVVFNVRMVNSGCQYLARAFFPNSSRRNREILVDRCAFNYGNSPSITGVLRHELGHTIGFRHEHTRPEAGACFEDNYWRVLTPYDRASVMHYPQCNGTGDWSLTLTNYDKSGAASAYP